MAELQARYVERRGLVGTFLKLVGLSRRSELKGPTAALGASRQATLHEDRVDLELSTAKLAELLGIAPTTQQANILLSVPALRQSKGHQIRLVIEGTAPPAKPVSTPTPQRNNRFLTQLADAFAARKLVLDNPHLTLAELAKREGRCRKHLAKLVEMSCLGPTFR